MEPCGSKLFKTVFLPQITIENFETSELWIFFIFLNMGPDRGNYQNATPPTNRSRKFQTSPEISSQWSSQKYCFRFLKFRVYDFSLFSLTHGTRWEQNLQNTTPSSSHYRKFWNFSWIFFSIGLTEVLSWMFEILSFWFLTNFWNAPLDPMVKPKTPLSGNRATVEQNSEICALGVSIRCIHV